MYVSMNVYVKVHVCVRVIVPYRAADGASKVDAFGAGGVMKWAGVGERGGRAGERGAR
jgi:hypothetical protein